MYIKFCNVQRPTVLNWGNFVSFPRGQFRCLDTSVVFTSVARGMLLYRAVEVREATEHSMFIDKRIII